MTTQPIVLEITPGAELPDRTLTWQTAAGTVIDFAADPHTFRLEINFQTPIVKTAGITGSATAPNVTITFATGETDGWPPSSVRALLWAKRTSDGKDREPVRMNVLVNRPIV